MKADVRELARKIYEEPSVYEEAEGLKVEIKPVPDAVKPGVMDAREFYIRKALYELQKKLPPAAPDLELIRRQTQTYCKPIARGDIEEKRFTVNACGREVPVFFYDGGKGDGRAALVYIHGGSFIAGSAESYREPCRFIAEAASCAVFNIDYSLAPENPYPAAVEDCTALIGHIYDGCKEFGIDRDKIVLSGDSAGANLAVAAAMSCPDSIKIRRLELFYPVVDMYSLDGLYEWSEDKYTIDGEQREIIESRLVLGRADGKGNNALMELILSAYLGERFEELKRDARVSPIYGDLSGLPECTVYTAEFDGLRLQEEYFARKYTESGGKCRLIRYNGVSHAFLDYTGVVPQAEAALSELAEGLKRL
ncbi:MAG: alpha/beta hydrolase [Butyrivibrio sp.]|nr:alpha/beta hydrolase [Butyrivibrio sp.]